MKDDLVTAAVFGDQTQAVVARNHLEEAGVPAFMTDETMSSGLFGAVGAARGIRIQVPASRLEEAVRLINDRLPEHAVPVNWSEVDVGQPEAEEPVDDEDNPKEGKTEPVAPPLEAVVETEPSDLTLREQRANRIVLGALVGLFCLPVMILAFCRMIQIANSTERLRPEYQRKANIGSLIVMAYCLLLSSFCCFIPIYQLAR